MTDLIIPMPLWTVFRQEAYDRGIMVTYKPVAAGIQILSPMKESREIYDTIRQRVDRKGGQS